MNDTSPPLGSAPVVLWGKPVLVTLAIISAALVAVACLGPLWSVQVSAGLALVLGLGAGALAVVRHRRLMRASQVRTHQLLLAASRQQGEKMREERTRHFQVMTVLRNELVDQHRCAVGLADQIDDLQSQITVFQANSESMTATIENLRATLAAIEVEFRGGTGEAEVYPMPRRPKLQRIELASAEISTESVEPPKAMTG